jgi:hypothetical protein
MWNTLSAVPDAFKPPPELVDFVKRQIREAQVFGGEERRSEERHLMLVPVLVQPVNAQYNPIGDPFVVVTRDISRKGIGLVHGQRIAHPLVALRMSLAGEEVNVVARLVRSEALGPYYFIGGEFVAKLARFQQPDGVSSSDRSRDVCAAANP